MTNTGTRAGADVAQIYVSAKKPRVPRPKRELKGFARVRSPRAKRNASSIPLDARSFTYYDVGAKGWRVDSGRYSVELARSAESIEARQAVNVARPALLSASQQVQ